LLVVELEQLKRATSFRDDFMDEEQLRRLAEGYRQMRDEQLAALLAERSTLTDEAHQALLDVIAARPDSAGIHQRAMAEVRSEAERQFRKGAKRKAKEEAKIQRASDRPDLGLSLWFLTVTLGALALWRVYPYVMLRVSEAQVPEYLEMEEWLPYKTISLGLAVSALIAAGMAIHAIHAGTTHSHLRRVIVALWYISPGVLVIDLAASGLLFGLENFRLSMGHVPTVIHLVIAVLIASLWTAYLTRSQRCGRRYPTNAAEESVARAFD
jgi:hypothetical protein